MALRRRRRARARRAARRPSRHRLCCSPQPVRRWERGRWREGRSRHRRLCWSRATAYSSRPVRRPPEFLFIFCLLYPLLQALTAFALPCALFFCFSCSGAPAIFCLKPGRIGTVVAVSKVRCDLFLLCLTVECRDKLRLVCAQDHGDATPFKVRAQDNGRSSWFGRQHLAHA